MQLLQIARASVNTAALLLSLFWVDVVAQTTDSQTKTDNTAVNKHERSPGAATADQQKMNATDRNLTAKIRRSVMADKSLSTYAHNVKIISQAGTLTLKGPVRSDGEMKSIVSKTIAITNSAVKSSIRCRPASPAAKTAAHT